MGSITSFYRGCAAANKEQNPVRAGLAATPWDYPWSSAAAHVAGSTDQLVRVAPLAPLVGDWRGFLATGPGGREVQELRRHERSGRPLGREPFVRAVERKLGGRSGAESPGQSGEGASQ
jgi:putative transposase